MKPTSPLKTFRVGALLVFAVGCTTVKTTQSGLPIGYFPLPSALSGDPKEIPIPALKFDVVKPQRVDLKNGIKVYYLVDHAAPLVTVRTLVAAGTVDEPADKLGVADLMFELMGSGGAGDSSADALDDFMEYHAADVQGDAAEEYGSIDLRFRSQDLDSMLPKWADIVRRPRFDKDRFEIAIDRELETVRRRTDHPDGLAARALRKAVYGPDSRLAREATAQSLRSVTLSDVKTFYRGSLYPKAISLLVTGDFDQEKVRPAIEKLFGDWTGPELAPRSYPSAPHLKRRVILVPKEVAQAKIRIGTLGFERLSPLEYPYRILNNALGSFGVGRFYKQIRDIEGLAYAAYSVVSPGPSGGLFYAGVDTDPKTVQKALTSALKILDGPAKTQPVTEQEISVATDMYLNSFAFRFDSADKVAHEKAVFDLFHYPEDYLDAFRMRLSHTTPAQIKEVASQLSAGENYQIVVVGPPALIGDLSAFGPVTVIRDVEAFQ